MRSTPRYAIYYVPAASSELYRFGAALLGYDAFSGDALAFPEGLPPDWQELTHDPRKYGFHATLKAPFALAAGETEAALIDALDAFAAAPRAIPEIAPVVRTISGFTAVVPSEASSDLTALARDCVVAFDHFRAPLTSADRIRRNPDALTPRQVELLDRWGYPYVMEAFFFHMTLTGRLPAERRAAVLEMLQQRFATLSFTTLRIDHIGLFRQDDSDARFRIIAHVALS